jgi:hypothetical protein
VAENVRLDRVFLFGDQLSFLIPHDWRESEEEEDDHYLFHQPGTDSGWLRVTLIKSRSVDRDPSERLKETFSKKSNMFVDAKTQNLVSKSAEDSEESGDRIHLY